MPVKLGAAPQHGFDEPLGLLSDCHRRIEQFLSVLRQIGKQGGGGPLCGEHRAAVETALTYFRTAAHRHNEDEENSLFPRLRDCSQPDVAAAFGAMESLQADHAAAAPMHQEVDRLYRLWLDSGSLPQEQVARLALLLEDLGRMYQSHIKIEDEYIFPLAAAALSHEELIQLGNEMARRRGINAKLRPYTQTEGDIPMTAEQTIDVRTIPGPQRHPLVFHVFERLRAGQAMEIVNDHDPFPLHNQFDFMKRGQFSWGYLQQGPGIWRVRIGKVEQPRVS